MSRDWFAVYSRVLTAPKWRRLSDAARLSIVYVWALAGREVPEATWPDRDFLARTLALHDRPPETVDELIGAGWLDVLADGRVRVHDWDEWQLAGSKRIRDDWQAAYQRGWRRERKARADTETGNRDRDRDRDSRNHDVITPARNGSSEDDGSCAKCHGPITGSSYVSLLPDGRKVCGECAA